MSDHEPVAVGVVGLGRSGWGIHLKTLKERPEQFRVAAVADPDTGRGEEARAAFGCAAYPAIETLLADAGVELVVVATPNRFHAPHAVAALDAGKHVVCEKPFGLSVADVDAMIAARDKAAARVGRPVLLAPFQNRRFEWSFETVREVLRSGRLGGIVHVRMAYHGFGRRWDWQTLRSWGGGQLNNNGPHPLDQALEFFADFGVTSAADIDVFADLRNTLSSGDAEDHVRLTLRAPRHPDAPAIDIEFTAACPYPQDQWLVMATAGGLRGTGKQLSWKWVDWSAMPPRPADEKPTPDRSYNREELTWQEETAEIPADLTGGEARFYDGLYGALRRGEPLLVTPETVRHRIAVIEKARRAAERGGAPAPA